MPAKRSLPPLLFVAGLAATLPLPAMAALPGRAAAPAGSGAAKSGTSPAATAPEDIPPAKPLTSEALERILSQLTEIDSALQDKRNAYNLTLLPRLNEAGNNDDKAFALWLDATRDIDFEREGKTATEFSDFRNGKAKEQRGNSSFTTQLRLQCRFLALIIQQAAATKEGERLELASDASAYTDDFIASAKKLAGKHDELRRNALDSVIARHLKLDVTARKTADGEAAYTPGSLSEIYHNMILPCYREKRAAAQITSAWNKRISQETTLVELNKVPEQLEKFQTERVPELKWGMAKDLYQAGHQEPAAAAMVGIIKGNLSHRSTAGWIKELTALVEQTAARQNLPVPAAAPAPVPGAIPAPAAKPAAAASATIPASRSGLRTGPLK